MSAIRNVIWGVIAAQTKKKTAVNTEVLVR